MKVMAIVPARAGSKGVPGKNTRLLGGFPLISFSIVAARLTKYIERVLVSTDSEKIAEITREYGAEAPFLRPARWAQDNSPDCSFVLHAINWLEDHEKAIPDYLVLLRPTTPLREPEVVDAAIEAIIKHPEATSLRSAHPAPESPLKWFQKDEAGYFKALFEGLSNDQINNPRQQFPEAFVPDGYVDIVKPSFIRTSGLLYGPRMLGFGTPFCAEVDTESDFTRLEYDLKMSPSVVWDYLNQNYPKRDENHVGI